MSLTERYCIATLPLLYNPVNKLALNKVNPKINAYKQQNRKFYLNLKDKKDALKSESKLQELGHVPYLAHLPPNLQDMLIQNPVQNYIPWRAVWNKISINTPRRIVFDALKPIRHDQD